MSVTRLYTYLRKSTESEERQELSIPAQQKELVDLVSRRGLVVVGEPIKESRTAKMPGRPKFNEMVENIQRGEADGILCWHLDRLARNPVDGGNIIWLLGEGVIKEIVTPNRVFTGSADDKLMMSIIFGMATKVSDDLSNVIRRGNRECLEEGRWPGKPKLGYMRDFQTKEVVPDPKLFDLVKEIWRLRLDGTSTQEILHRTRDEWGLLTPVHGKSGGKKLSSSQLYRVLKDPFYAGLMFRGEETYQGNHTPMITWEEFEQVQRMFRRDRGPNACTQKNLFTYRGLIACGACQATVTVQNTKNRHGTSYIHYRCARKKKKYSYCPEGSVQEQVIDREVEKFLEGLYLSADLADWVSARISSLEEERIVASRSTEERLAERVAQIQSRLEGLRGLVADGLISRDEFKSDKEKLLKQQHALERQLREPEAVRTNGLLQPWRDGLSLANLALFWFRNGNSAKKRQVVKSTCYNLFLEGKKLSIEGKKILEEYRKLQSVPSKWRWWNEVKTQILNNHDKMNKL